MVRRFSGVFGLVPGTHSNIALIPAIRQSSRWFSRGWTALRVPLGLAFAASLDGSEPPRAVPGPGASLSSPSGGFPRPTPQRGRPRGKIIGGAIALVILLALASGLVYELGMGHNHAQDAGTLPNSSGVASYVPTPPGAAGATPPISPTLAAAAKPAVTPTPFSLLATPLTGTATPLPSGTGNPSPAPTAAPATATPGAGATGSGPPLSLVAAPGTIVRPGKATVTVRTTPGAACTITVRYSSGPSHSKALDPKSAANGLCSWTWDITTRTSAGTWPITVTATAAGGTSSLSTQVVVK